MHGTIIDKGLKDWQILKQENGSSKVHITGTYVVPDAAYEFGVTKACPVIRIISEEDNSQVTSWKETSYSKNPEDFSGAWETELEIPAGGLYRIETGLDTKSKDPNLSWIFRGDVRFHIGVGDVFVIAGQSNSSGYGKDSHYDPPEIGVHFYRNMKKWDLATHPLNESTNASNETNAEMGVSGVSPYISFAKNFKKSSKYPVGLIPVALGGSPISRWCPSQNGDLFYNMIDRIKSCNTKISGILWYQGCSDANDELAYNYLENFNEVVEETRKALNYDVPFFTFQINRLIEGEYDIEWGVVREAQRKAANDLKNVFVLPTLNCTLSDVIHNDAKSNVMLGSHLSKLCSHVLLNKKAFFAPDIEKATYKNNKLSVSFKNVSGKIMLYSTTPDDNDFEVKDSEGIININSLTIDKSSGNTILFDLDKKPEKNAVISFAFKRNPTSFPPVDDFTYLPILSFYKFPIDIK